MTSEKYIELNLVIHRFHCFCKYWWSNACEKLLRSLENDYIFDMFQIETSLENSQVVGNATREGLRMRGFLLDGRPSRNVETMTTIGILHCWKMDLGSLAKLLWRLSEL